MWEHGAHAPFKEGHTLPAQGASLGCEGERLLKLDTRNLPTGTHHNLQQEEYGFLGAHNAVGEADISQIIAEILPR